MLPDWIVARRLCYEKLSVAEREILVSKENEEKRMFGSNEVMRLFVDRLRPLYKMKMPENSIDIFFKQMIPCCPKVTIEVEEGNKNIGGTDILRYFGSIGIQNIIHIWDKNLDDAGVKLWKTAYSPSNSPRRQEDGEPTD